MTRRRTAVSAVPVSKRALIARINRKLRPNYEMLRRPCSPRWVDDLGDYYVIDVRAKGITKKYVDLEEFGRELGVLYDYERLVADD